MQILRWRSTQDRGLSGTFDDESGAALEEWLLRRVDDFGSGWELCFVAVLSDSGFAFADSDWWDVSSGKGVCSDDVFVDIYKP